MEDRLYKTPNFLFSAQNSLLRATLPRFDVDTAHEIAHSGRATGIACVRGPHAKSSSNGERLRLVLCIEAQRLKSLRQLGFFLRLDGSILTVGYSGVFAAQFLFSIAEKKWQLKECRFEDTGAPHSLPEEFQPPCTGDAAGSVLHTLHRLFVLAGTLKLIKAAAKFGVPFEPLSRSVSLPLWSRAPDDSVTVQLAIGDRTLEVPKFSIRVRDSVRTASLETSVLEILRAERFEAIRSRLILLSRAFPRAVDTRFCESTVSLLISCRSLRFLAVIDDATGDCLLRGERLSAWHRFRDGEQAAQWVESQLNQGCIGALANSVSIELSAVTMHRNGLEIRKNGWVARCFVSLEEATISDSTGRVERVAIDAAHAALLSRCRQLDTEETVGHLTQCGLFPSSQEAAIRISNADGCRVEGTIAVAATFVPSFSSVLAIYPDGSFSGSIHPTLLSLLDGFLRNCQQQGVEVSIAADRVELLQFGCQVSLPQLEVCGGFPTDFCLKMFLRRREFARFFQVLQQPVPSTHGLAPSAFGDGLFRFFEGNGLIAARLSASRLCDDSSMLIEAPDAPAAFLDCLNEASLPRRGSISSRLDHLKKLCDGFWRFQGITTAMREILGSDRVQQSADFSVSFSLPSFFVSFSYCTASGHVSLKQGMLRGEDAASFHAHIEKQIGSNTDMRALIVSLLNLFRTNDLFLADYCRVLAENAGRLTFPLVLPAQLRGTSSSLHSTVSYSSAQKSVTLLAVLAKNSSTVSVLLTYDLERGVLFVPERYASKFEAIQKVLNDCQPQPAGSSPHFSAYVRHLLLNY